MIYGIDVSRWQTKVDWTLLKAAGIQFVFIKATQGDYHKDQLLEQHVTGARQVGMTIGLYHWADPLVDAKAQAAWFVKCTQGLPFDMVANDVEQFWADWKEWSAGNITQYLTPAVISDNARQILEYWDQRLSVPRVLYSRASFIHSFARPMLDWLAKYPLWMAHYPYDTTKLTTTWEKFFAQHLPPASLKNPLMPQGTDPASWKFWQFTGDKFILPGVDTALDVNAFNGEMEDLQDFVGKQDQEEEEPPMGKTIFVNYPKGIYAAKQVIDPAQLKGSFVVAQMGADQEQNINFTNLVGWAAEAPGKPYLLAMYDLDPQTQVDNFHAAYDWNWPGFETSIIGKFLLRMLFSGEARPENKRRVHGLILKIAKIRDPQGKPIDIQWIFYTCAWIAKHILKTAGIPTMIYLDHALCKELLSFQHDNDVNWPNLLGKLQFIKPWEQNWGGLLPGVATWVDAWQNTSLQTLDWNALPVPDDAYMDRLRAEAMDSGLGNAPARPLICYSTGDYTAPGVGPVALFLWMGPDFKTYWGIQEESLPPAEDPGEEPGEEPGGDTGGEPCGQPGEQPVDLTAVLAQMDAINANLAAINKNLAKIAAPFKDSGGA